MSLNATDLAITMPKQGLDTVRADFDTKLERRVVSVDLKLNEKLKVQFCEKQDAQKLRS